MNNLAWDANFERLTQKISQIRSQQIKSYPKDHQAIVEAKLALMQFHAFLQRAAGRLKRIAEQRKSLSLRERSYVYWAAVFSEKAQHLFAIQTVQSSKSMWMQLLESRLGSKSKQATAMISDDSLLEIAAKQQRFAQTEDALKLKLTKLKQDREDTRSRHDQWSTKQANDQAAKCFVSKLGATSQEVTQNPSVKGTVILLRKLSQRVFASKKKQDELTKYERLLDERSRRVVAYCRDIALASISAPTHTQIEEIDQMIRHAEQEMNQITIEIDRLLVSGGYSLTLGQPALRKTRVSNKEIGL